MTVKEKILKALNQKGLPKKTKPQLMRQVAVENDNTMRGRLSELVRAGLVVTEGNKYRITGTGSIKAQRV